MASQFVSYINNSSIEKFKRNPEVNYRTMYYIAKRGLAIACRPSVYLSVCLSVCLWRWWLPLELFVYLRLIIGTLFLCISVHLTVLLLSNPVLNLIFLLLPITSSHSHAIASDSTFDFWRYINISLTLTRPAIEHHKGLKSLRNC